MDIESLLTPVSDDAPAGPDLSYDDGRIQIEAAFESSFSTSGGDEERPSDVNWPETIAAIAAQAERTRDVWLAVYLMRAGAAAGRLEVVEDGAALLAGLFDRFWDSVHPDLEEYGLQGRISPCQSLTGIPEFLGPLRRMTLVAHPRLGAYSAADFERFAANGTDEDGYGMFRAAMQEIEQAEIETVLGKLDAIQASLTAVDNSFAQHAPGEGPSFEPTYAALKSVKAALAPFGPATAQDEVAEVDGSDDGDHDGSSSEGGGGGGARRPGRIESRDDVMAALDAIADYYRRREPSSPVPLALQRARNWVALDFMQILEDIAPESLGEAGRVLTYKAGQSSDDGWSSE